MSQPTKSELPFVKPVGTLVEVHRFIWNIANFLEIKESEEQLNAQQITFQIGSTIGLPLKLKCFLHLKKEKDDNVRFAGFFLQLIESPKNDGVALVGSQFGVRTPSQFARYRVLSAEELIEDAHGFWKLIPLDSNSNLTQDGVLPLEIWIYLYNLREISLQSFSLSALSTIQAEYQVKFCRRFAKELKQLGKDPKYDKHLMLTLISKDGEYFHENEGLLAIRCQELRKLVGKGRLASDSQALGILLHFLNTATLTDNWRKEDVLPELVLAAHFYKLEELKDFLNEALAHVCTKKNAAKLSKLAKKLGMKRASKELLEFMRKNFKKGQLKWMIMEEELAEEETFEGWAEQEEKKTGILNKIKRITGF